MAENQTKHALGIACDIVNEDTGVPSAFHAVGAVYLDLANKYHTVTVQSYFNKKMFEKGKHPVGAGVQIAVEGTPPRGADIIDWVLRSVTAQTDNADNPFAGAQLVYAE